MKKVVVTFGLISGAISSLMMAGIVLSDLCFSKTGEILGYTSIVVSFLLVFFGIRSYRDNVAGGAITFARAFSVGILISLIACVCYVIAWEFLYYQFLPDFSEKFLAYQLERLQASGASQEAIQAHHQQMTKFMEMYRNPVFHVAFTFIEPFPIGLIMALLSAAILRKRKPPQFAEASVAGA